MTKYIVRLNRSTAEGSAASICQLGTLLDDLRDRVEIVDQSRRAFTVTCDASDYDALEAHVGSIGVIDPYERMRLL